MKLIFATIFTILCKPGIITSQDDFSQKQCKEQHLVGLDNTYYFFNIDLKEGNYLYCSFSKDTVWFYVEHNNIFYLDGRNKANKEFKVNKW